MTVPSSPSFSLETLIDSFPESRVLVIGDLMLDRFISGDVTRISPERPVPVLAAAHETKMLGGAGNVIANLRSLGVGTAVIGVVGMDGDGQEVRAILEQSGVLTAGLVTAADRPTISKTRFMSGGQHLLRVDGERVLPLSREMEDALLVNLRAELPGCKMLVLSDYGKGTLSDRVIAEAIKAASLQGVPVLVDPKGRQYTRYNGASILTPNRKELSDATNGMPTASDADVAAAVTELRRNVNVGAVIVTRSEQGMSIFDGDTGPLHLPTDALEVFDVSGAGDTVIATLAAALASGAALKEAATLANAAAGLVVAKMGTATVRPDELKARLGLAGASSFLSWEQARDQVKLWQSQGLKVGFTNGCFDILHAGHVNYLNETRQYCDRLVLGLNHDRSVRILKGPTRPVNVEHDRATVMAGLKAVSMVVLFGATEAGEDNTPCELIAQVKPDIFFKGGDYTIATLPEAKVVHGYGGEVKIMGLTEGLSTTKTIEKIGAGKAA